VSLSSHPTAPRSTPSVYPTGPTRVLIVSAEASRRRSLARALIDEHEVLTAEDEAVGLSLLANTPADVVVLDALGRKLQPDPLEGFFACCPGLELILLGEENPDTDTSVTSRAFLTLPRGLDTPEQVARITRRACERKMLVERARRLERKLDQQDPAVEIVGASRAMDPVFELAHAAAVVTTPVLLVGESGTGKELLGRAIHRQGRRASGPFVALECAAVPADRINRELFGPPPGARTMPLALAADGGTLLLADVTALPPESQARLTRLLQHGEVEEPSGQTRTVDVRVIATSCVEVKPLVDAGTVRRDLYFHLNAIVMRVPPLRRRREDVPLLAYHFLQRHAQRLGRQFERISAEAMRMLRDHRWAGNVRELENAMGRAVALSRGDVIVPSDLAFLREEQASSVVLEPGPAPRETAFDPSLLELPYPEAKKQAVAAFDRAYVREVMRRTGDNVSEAARQSGLDRSNFRRVMKKAE